MTIMEAGHKLMGWFKENDYLEEKDFPRVLDISDTPERDRACLRLALSRLEEYKYIKTTTMKREDPPPEKATKKTERTSENVDLWVMEKPLSSIEQSVELNSELIFALTESVNAFCDEIGDKTDYVNPIAIDPKDIRNLLFMYNHRTEKVRELMFKDEIKNDLDL